MPELPEVEILVRHLAPLLKRKTIRALDIRRPKVVAPTTPGQFVQKLRRARFLDVQRRAKFLVFTLRQPGKQAPLVLLGHLGMTGRMYLLARNAPLPKHAAVSFDLGRERFVFEDTRYFGRLTLNLAPLDRLGPEPLDPGFTDDQLAAPLKRSAQPIKVKLLDQHLVAGIGNIYASEALFRAGISPKAPARRLSREQIGRLRRAIRDVLTEAIACGSTVPLNYAGVGERDGLFYFGRAPGAPDYYEERLRVYDREGQSCPNCGTPIQRLVQAARSTYFCPSCQCRKSIKRRENAAESV